MADMTNMEPAGRVIAVFRGEYNDAETYEYYDEVLYKNSSYIAKRTTSGNPPPTGTVSDDNWRLVAKGIMDADISESEIVFEEAAERSNIESGEKSKTIMGKIRKIFSDLKSVAFSGKYADLEGIPDLKKVATSGSYDDLENKPSIPAAAQNGALTIQRNGTDVQSFSADQSIDVVVNIEVPEISRSTAITAAGEYALDAIEKNASIEGTLAYQIAQQNNNLSNIANKRYRKGADGYSLPHAVWTSVLELTLPAGTYIVAQYVNFPGAVSGTRSIRLCLNDVPYTPSPQLLTAMSGERIQQSYCTFIKISTNTKLGFQAYQNSNSSMTLDNFMYDVLKIV